MLRLLPGAVVAFKGDLAAAGAQHHIRPRDSNRNAFSSSAATLRNAETGVRRSAATVFATGTSVAFFASSANCLKSGKSMGIYLNRFTFASTDVHVPEVRQNYHVRRRSRRRFWAILSGNLLNVLPLWFNVKPHIPMVWA
jgi:hypothetical protein